MKIACLLLLITFALLSCQTMQIDLDSAIVLLNSSLTIDETYSIEEVFSANLQSNYHFEDSQYVIYGNYTDFDSDLLYSLTHDSSKVCIFYDLNLSDNINDNYEILRNNAVVYYYKNGIPHISSYRTNSVETEDVISGINGYINKMITEISENSADTYALNTDTSMFTQIYAATFFEEKKPYGYIEGEYFVKKYRANDVSSLYLIETRASYTPGKVAVRLGDYSYGDWYNSGGYLRVRAERAQFDVGYDQIRYGGKPYLHDAYPINSPQMISISSNCTEALTLGYSFINGFSLYDLNTQAGVDFGAEIDYSYNKTYTTTEPALTAQVDSQYHENKDDAAKFSWVYTYTDPKLETNHLHTGYLFEMNNSGHDLYEGDLAVRIEYQMIVGNSTSRDEEEYTEVTFTDYLWHNYY